MYLNKNRSREEIVASILTVVMRGPRKTHIMYGANLSYALLCKYLNKLVDCGLVNYRENDRVYELTCNGEAYLIKYGEYKHQRSRLEVERALLDKKMANLNKILELDTRSSDIKKLVISSIKNTNVIKNV